jgi:hypothetical protein
VNTARIVFSTILMMNSAMAVSSGSMCQRGRKAALHGNASIQEDAHIEEEKPEEEESEIG